MGCLNYRILFFASETKHLSRSRGQPCWWDSPVPGFTSATKRRKGRGNKVQRHLTGSSCESRAVRRTRSCRLKGKAARQSPAAHTAQTTPAEDKSEGLSTGMVGQDCPFSLGKLGEKGSAELWLSDGAGRERRNGNCLPKRCEESPSPGGGLCVLLESPLHHQWSWEEEEESWEEGEEHQATWLQFELLSPFTTSGFSQR